MGKKEVWTEDSWKHLLDCLSESSKVKDAYNKFHKKYPKIDERTIRDKFDREALGSPSSHLSKEITFDPNSYMQQEKNKKKAALIRQAEQQELSKYRKQVALTDIILDQLRAEIYKLPKPETPKPSKKIANAKKDHIDVMAIVSDCQIGQKVTLKDVGGLNEYNFDVFLKELFIWKNEVIRFVEVQQLTHTVDNIIIPFLGDIVEGHDIFSGQAYHLDMHICNQVVNGSQVFAQALAEISITFPEIRILILGIPGNHGRVGRKGEAPSQCNWDVICYKFLECELTNYKKENGGNIEFQWSDAWFQLLKSKGWVFCFIHGEDIKSWMGMPYYGVDRAKAKYMEMLNSYFTYFVLGHHHKEAELPSDNGEKIVNGNWVGGNDGSKIWMGSNNPNQWIFTINEKYGILLREKIYLKTRHESKPKIKIFE